MLVRRVQRQDKFDDLLPLTTRIRTTVRGSDRRARRANVVLADQVKSLTGAFEKLLGGHRDCGDTAESSEIYCSL